MNTNLIDLVCQALYSVKVIDLVVYDTRQLTPMFDTVIIGTGQSNRQVKALAKRVYDDVRANKQPVHVIDGMTFGNWVVIDLGAVLVHIMSPEMREFYRLEEIWSGVEIAVASDEITTKRPAVANVD